MPYVRTMLFVERECHDTAQLPPAPTDTHAPTIRAHVMGLVEKAVYRAVLRKARLFDKNIAAKVTKASSKRLSAVTTAAAAACCI